MSNKSWTAGSKLTVLNYAREDLIKFARWGVSPCTLEVLDEIINEYKLRQVGYND